MTTLDELVGDVASNAQLAQRAHAEVIKLVMASIDLVDLVQRGEATPDIAALRRHVGPILRRSDAQHSLAVAALALEGAPEHAEQMIEHADEVYPEGGE